MKKKVITIAMLAALAVGSVVSLTACGGGGSGSSAAPESSAPASSAPEVVSSEAAAPESETPAMSTESALSLLEGVEIKNGTFQVSPQELAEKINAACSVMGAEQCTISDHGSNLVYMSFDSGYIMISSKNGNVSSIIVQTKEGASEGLSYWLPIMTALLGVDEITASKDAVDSHFAKITEKSKRCFDTWNDVEVFTNTLPDLFTMSFTAK